MNEAGPAADSPGDDATAGHRRGSASYAKLLTAMFCAGVATFAQLYAPQAVLPAISAGLGVPPAGAALLVSAATAGLALSVLAWSWLADRSFSRPWPGCWCHWWTTSR